MASPKRRERWHKHNRQSTELKQHATSPEGVLYSPQSDGPHRNHKSSVKISFCLVLKAAGEVNTTQLRTQGLSFQYFNFCASSCATQLLHSEWIKASTATAAQLFVYIPFVEIYVLPSKSTNFQCTSPQSPLYTNYHKTSAKRRLFTPSPLQLEDVKIYILPKNFAC